MDVNALLSKLKARIDTNEPVQNIPIIPNEGATIDNCFINVSDKVSLHGGSIVYGWDLMLTNLLFEAQRHAIWQSPSGELLDITPRKYKINYSMFIADDRWYYNGHLTDNIRFNVTNNPVVDDFILVAETIIKLYQTGIRNEKGELILIDKIISTIQILERMRDDLNLFLIRGGHTESICFCCNKEIYYNCFGANVRSQMELILQMSSVLLQRIENS